MKDSKDYIGTPCWCPLLDKDLTHNNCCCSKAGSRCHNILAYESRGWIYYTCTLTGRHIVWLQDEQ